MTPREIDALVGTKILGLAVSHQAGWSDYYVPIDAATGRWNILPRYSTDIKAAFQVVEKMRELGWGFHCDDQYPGSVNDPGPWWVEFEQRDSDVGDQAHGAALPAVICEAALRALGVGVEG